MASRIDAINITCSNPDALGSFWRDVLNLREDPENPNEPGDSEIIYTTEPMKITFLFQPVEDGADFAPRIHFDVDAIDRTRDEEVDRLIGMGAVVVADRRQEDGSGWVTLRDQDGYEMCVQRSQAEREGLPLA